MKAAICTKYGAPEVLQIKEVFRPEPKDDDILVRIHASTVNSADVRVRSLDTNGIMKLVMQLVLGVSKPRKPILGTIFSGRVEDIGHKITKFKVGDKVFGMTGFRFGTHAEYTVVHQDSNVCEMPNDASYKEAAAIVFGGQTAIYYLRKANIEKRPSPKIMVIGATGSVGSSAIQIAKHYVANVTAVTSSKGEKLCQKLGVEQIMLYDKADFTKCNERYDIIFDASGKYSKKQFKHMLNKNGVYKSVNRGFASESQEQLQILKAMYESGKLRACIDKVFPLDDIVAAHKYVESHQKTGNVVLKIND